jgi:hypothetical protein
VDTQRRSEKDFGDYEFIATEIERLVKLPAEAQLARFRSDPWGTLVGLKAVDGSFLPLSREASDRFRQIAIRGLKTLGERARDHQVTKVADLLKTEFVDFVRRDVEINSDNAHEVFEAAISKLGEEYSELTHYVPCSVVIQQATTTFNIGPVTFRLREAFLKDCEPDIIRCLDSGGKNTQFTEHTRMRLHRFFDDYQWIACVTIPPCDPKISRRRAYAVIQKALDVFKIFVGSDRGTHVRHGHDFNLPADYVELAASGPQEFLVTIGGNTQDAVLNDNWYEQALAHPSWPLLHAVLTAYREHGGVLDEIQSRFLDALSWHSDAISETDLGARIMKFWIAIERLLSLSRGSNVAARCAVLFSTNSEEFATRCQSLSIAYQRRSDVVHGDADRSSESWYVEAAAEAEEASTRAVFKYLDAITHIRQSGASSDHKKIRLWLNALDGLASTYRKQAKQKSTL